LLIALRALVSSLGVMASAFAPHQRTGGLGLVVKISGSGLNCKLDARPNFRRVGHDFFLMGLGFFYRASQPDEPWLNDNILKTLAGPPLGGRTHALTAAETFRLYHVARPVFYAQFRIFGSFGLASIRLIRQVALCTFTCTLSYWGGRPIREGLLTGAKLFT